MASSRVRDEGDTPSRILDSAESLVQIRGFNGFSYADVAAELALTTASLHYHFPGKSELGRALITRYAMRFNAALARIDGAGKPRARSSVRMRASMPTSCAVSACACAACSRPSTRRCPSRCATR